VTDQEGVELSDPNAAVLMARRTLGEMVCHDVLADRDSSARRIVVTDENGRDIADVSAPPITVAQPATRAAAAAVPASR
jgi:hypothetical protein